MWQRGPADTCNYVLHACMTTPTSKKCLALNGHASARYQLVLHITGTPLLKMRSRKLKKEKNLSNASTATRLNRAAS